MSVRNNGDIGTFAAIMECAPQMCHARVHIVVRHGVPKGSWKWLFQLPWLQNHACGEANLWQTVGERNEPRRTQGAREKERPSANTQSVPVYNIVSYRDRLHVRCDRVMTDNTETGG